MSAENAIKKKYADLCQTLGDLVLKKENAENEIASLQHQLKTLISISSEIIAAEKVANDERQKSGCSNCACNAGSNPN